MNNNNEFFFNFNRFRIFLACYFGEQRRSLMIFAIIVLSLPALILCLSTWLGQSAYEFTRLEHMYINYGELTEINDPQHVMVCSILVCLSLLLATVSGSMTFSALSSKSSRTNFLMVPATIFEKFSALFLIYIVGFSVLMLVSVNLANLLRYALFFQLSEHLKPLSFYETICLYKSGYVFRQMFALWGLFGILITTFMTGSVLWPKNSYIKTTVALIALSCILGFIFGFVMISYEMASLHITERFEWMNQPATLFSVLIVIEALYCIAATVFCYFRLKQWEIVARW